MTNSLNQIIHRNDTHHFEKTGNHVIIQPREKAIHLAYFDPCKAYISNPGMGIQGYAYSDHMHIGYTSAEWSASESYPPLAWDSNVFNHMVNLDEIDNVYIRVEWKDIQKEAGKLTLPPSWEALMEAVQSKGIRWSFRIMNSSPHSTTASSVPVFLEDKMRLIPYNHGGSFGGVSDPKCYPAYTSEYFKWWGEMLHLLGEKYDGDTQLEFADVSGFGLWGEGHHGTSATPGDTFKNYQVHSPDEMNEALDQLINLHLSAFPKTPAVMSMHLTEYEAGQNALRTGKCWLRRDSFMSSFSVNETKNVLEATSGQGMVWETIMPGCVYPTGGKTPESHFLKLPQRWADMGCHYGAVGFNAWDAVYAQENYPELFTDLQNRIGYRIRPAIIWRRSVDNGPEEIVIGLHNDGSVAPPGTLIIKAEFPGSEISSITLPEGKPSPGKMELYTIPAPDSLADSGADQSVTLTLQLQIKGKTHQIRWAVSVDDKHGVETLDIPLYRR